MAATPKPPKVYSSYSTPRHAKASHNGVDWNTVQKVLSDVLCLPLRDVQSKVSFLDLGGDSVTALEFSARCSTMDIRVQIRDIMESDSLGEMAAKLVYRPALGANLNVKAWKLAPDLDRQRVEKEVREQCGLAASHEISDMYPATALQEGLMALAVKQPGSYISTYKFALERDIDIPRFKAAWVQIIKSCPILRTRIVLVDGRFWQAVVAEDVQWQSSILDSDSQIKYGSRLCRYALHTEGEKHHFHLTMHHAVFDGWCLSLISETLAQCYYNGLLPERSLVPFVDFVDYSREMDTLSARNYWKRSLMAAKRTVFPRLHQVQSTASSSGSTTLRHHVKLPARPKSVTMATVLRAAWAIVLASYEDCADDVTFGSTVVGRQVPVDRIEHIAGPVISTVPVRVKLDRQQSVARFLQDVQVQATEMIAFEQLGLQNIAKLGVDAQEACRFSTLLVIQPKSIWTRANNSLMTLDDSALISYDVNNAKYYNYPLVLQGHLFDDEVVMYITHDTSALCIEQIERLARQYEYVVHQLLVTEARGEPVCLLGSVTMCGPKDIEEMKGWNISMETDEVSSCFHTLVEEQARQRPTAPAIAAWDGDFSYSELNATAERLAHHLVTQMRVTRGDLVMLCFEKSAWAYVAMLAINKAGGAWVPLDPTHPSHRHQQVIDQAGARLALASVEHADKCRKMLGSVVEVSPALDNMLAETPKSVGTPLRDLASPRDAAYVLFTSGTTGTPKGIVMEHRALCTSQVAIGRRLGLEAERVRLLQFAAYVFDLSIGEIIGPLISGACVCVPSEHERINDLAGFIRRAGVNWAFLTPSVVRLFKPEDVPGLELLLLTGEAAGHDQLATWIGRVRLLNGWGPSETCCFSTLHEWQTAMESPMTVGRPVGGYCWIVAADDWERLAPVGCIGEVVIQGPTIAREYLAYPEGTAANFITGLPAWALKTDQAPYSRFYRSGDLAYYNPDGTIEFVARRDTQVKIRGFRVELGEVEHHVREGLAGVQQVVVDVLEAKTRGGVPSLVAYLCFSSDTLVLDGASSEVVSDETCSDMLLALDESASREMSALMGRLSVRLPSYMVPTVYVPVRYMPCTTSQKVDRRKLRGMVECVSDEAFSRYMLANTVKEAPTTEMEARMQTLWGSVLGLVTETIGRNDSFLHLGGDSIAAIRLVAAAREIGIQMSVSAIFRDPRLSEVAASASAGEVAVEAQLQPWSLVPKTQRHAILQDVCEQCSMAVTSAGLVSDVYPATALQEGLMALATKQPGSYMARYTFELGASVDVERFKVAWEQTVQVCAVLRTRIVLSGGSSWQAVIDEAPRWRSADSLAAHTAQEVAMPMEYGLALCRFALLSEDEHRLFALTLHHAIFDGWSLGLIMRTLSRFYNGETPSQVALVPYVDFVNYATSLNTSLADEYWRTQLKGATRPTFPRVQAVSGQSPALPPASKSFSHKMSMRTHSSSSITRATVLRAAWAIVLARYNDDSDDITFGAAVAGRQAPVAGIGEMVGPVISTVPVRVKLSSQQSVLHYLRDIQVQGIEMVPFEQTGLQNIAKLSPDAHDACDLATLFVIQPQIIVRATSSSLFEPLESSIEPGDSSFTLAGYFTYPLVMQCHLWDSEVLLEVTFDTSVLCIEQIERLARQYEYVVHQLLATEARGEPACLLGSVTMCGPKDIEEMKGWNISMETDEVSSCFHTLVEEQARQRPTAPAIAAWDGDFSYSELNATAERLAHHLVTQMRVTRGDLVMLCFEKSAWAYVAMLAINKAGGAWVPLDPTHPSHRHQQVIDQAGARLALASVEHADKCRKMLGSVVEVSPALDNMLAETPKSVGTPLRDLASPRDAAYVLFTSGTTGTPKGIVMEHRALCTSQVAIGRRLGLEAERVRLLQFAAYVFDLSIGEIIGPLISGACVCVPSEHERINDLAGFIRRAGVNWAFLTPSVVRLFKPEDVPGLELLLLTGEAAGHDQLATWIGRVRLLNGWGPSETCCFSTLHEWQTAMESPMTVGRPVGGYCWIVAADDWERLAPVGCIGEVVIQGPTIAREYLAYPEGTAANFITGLPAWALKTDQAPYSRFYRSGDLAYYNPDGTIEFVARRDTQVKIRGFRVELGEVEHHVREGLAGVQQVVVDVLEAKTRGGVPSLVAYLCFSSDTLVLDGASSEVVSDETCSDMLLALDESASREMSALMGRLSVRLPSYMVPTVYVPVRYMPCTTSQKVDRRKLRGMVECVSDEAFSRYMLANTVKEAPTTEMEARMQTLWGSVLGLVTETIGRNDSFLHLGGDSIAAIRLVAAAREIGIQMSVSAIFRDPRLSEVAASASAGEVAVEAQLQPWSLVPKTQRHAILQDVCEQCSMAVTSAGLVSDVYPATALQEGLMALATKQPGSYMARYTFELGASVDVERFKVAWEQTVQVCAVLRTRIVLSGGSSWQAVIDEAPRWRSADSLAAHTAQEVAMPMEYGLALCRFALLSEDEHRLFALTLHHAIFDGWSLGLIMRTLSRFYNGETPSQVALVPYVDFVNYATSLNTSLADEYWRTQLKGATRPTFPRVQAVSGQSPALPSASKSFSHKMSMRTHSSSSITRATVLRAAWAVVLARYNDATNDITFGAVVTGRQAPLKGIEQMVGPVISTVPVRVKVHSHLPVTKFLHDIQTQSADMIPFEHTGLHNIAKLGLDARNACGFAALFVIQPRTLLSEVDKSALIAPFPSVSTVGEVDFSSYFTYPLVVQCDLDGDEVVLHFTFDTLVLSVVQIQAIARQYEHIVRQLLFFQNNDARVAILDDVSVSGPADLQQVLRWDDDVSQPVVVDRCVHDLISDMVFQTPQQEAIFAWDGRCTYIELDQMTTKLASHLRELGVGSESLVPVCFEKSMWTVVAMLAIMKAGGAFVPINPSQPMTRRQALVAALNAPLMLASPATADACKTMPLPILHVSASLLSTISPAIAFNGKTATSAHVVYVLFTSGSTGAPKGVVMEHRALASSIRGHGSAFGFRATSRVLQFSSYVFDACVIEIFTTLTFGGSICVPSEDDRLSGVTEFIRLARVNCALLTPSFVQSFRPDDVPSLEVLVLCGEIPNTATLEAWRRNLKLINGYGPAEACIAASSYEVVDAVNRPTTIGRACNNHLWIVEHDNHDRLAPIGCIGELLIQGPTLAREYLNDPEKTVRSFIHSPSWLPPGPYSRLYKTGDLARYNEDGTIDYVGRKDVQIKIRGQRVEPGEIEYHIKQYLGSRSAASVQVVQDILSAGSVSLVAFLCIDMQAGVIEVDATDAILSSNDDMMGLLRGLDHNLRAVLPEYMVPTYFLPMSTGVDS
nr:nonribosomal peptide synthetase vlms [Quercus suber]